MARPAQITQNKFPKSLQYFKKEVRNKVQLASQFHSVFATSQRRIDL